jgi:hypothetical protein
MSEIFSVQLTALFTAILGVGAIVTAVLAFMAWRKQSREVRDQAEMLRLQAEEFRQLSADREREADERRRAQAVMVFVWERLTRDRHNKEVVVAHVRNTSAQPVYGVQLYELANPGSGIPYGTLLQRTLPLMPGEEQTFPFDAPVPPRLPSGRTVYFCDRNGKWWEAHPSGILMQRPYPPPPAPYGENVVEVDSGAGEQAT